MFEARLLAKFFDETIKPDARKAFKHGKKVKIHGQAPDTGVSLVLSNKFYENDWVLDIVDSQDPINFDWERDPSLVQIHHHNGIGMDPRVGSLEAVYTRGLNHPHAEAMLLLLSKLAALDKANRNITTLLERYPRYYGPSVEPLLKLVAEFSEPGLLRVSQGNNGMPDRVAGIIVNPKMSGTSTIIVELQPRPHSQNFYVYAWVNWAGDIDEPYKGRQSVFVYNPGFKSYTYGEHTFGLTPGTVRAELSEGMLTFLNLQLEPQK